MVLFDENGNGINFDEKIYLTSGNCGNIYQISDDKLLKQYKEYCPKRYRIKKEVYDVLKSIDSDYIVKIYELYYNVQNEIEGYVMKYYRSDNIKLLECKTDYIINNINELFILLNEISKYDILIDDIKRQNIIFSDDKFILLDPDLYRYIEKETETCSKRCIKNINLRRLKSLIKELFDYELSLYHYSHFNCSPYHLLTDLINININKNLILVLNERLKKYEYPIDYFKQKQKKYY